MSLVSISSPLMVYACIWLQKHLKARVIIVRDIMYTQLYVSKYAAIDACT